MRWGRLGGLNVMNFEQWTDEGVTTVESRATEIPECQLIIIHKMVLHSLCPRLAVENRTLFDRQMLMSNLASLLNLI